MSITLYRIEYIYEIFHNFVNINVVVTISNNTEKRKNQDRIISNNQPSSVWSRAGSMDKMNLQTKSLYR